MESSKKELYWLQVSLILAICFYCGCSSPKYDFYDSIRNQNIEDISKFYGKIDPAEQESSMKKGLSIACEKGDKGVLDSLINLGGQLDSCDCLIDSIDKNNDFSFIVYVYGKNDRDQECLNRSMQKAISMYRTDMIKYLFEKRADINVITKNGETALHQAITNDDFTMIEYLLQNNADVNLADKEGETPLHLAVEAGNADILKSLILAGANVNAQKKAYKLEMSVPLEKGYQASFNYKDTGMSPLFLAVEKYITNEELSKDKYYKVIEMLLKENADPDIIVSEYSLVLRGGGSISMYEKLKDVGITESYADGTYFHSDGRGNKEYGNKASGLFFRIEGEGQDNLTVTTNNSVAPSPSTYYTSKTVSHLAAEKNETELLDLLKKYGADFSIKDSNGKTVMELMKQTQ